MCICPVHLKLPQPYTSLNNILYICTEKQKGGGEEYILYIAQSMHFHIFLFADLAAFPTSIPLISGYTVCEKKRRGGEGAFYELTAFQPALAIWPACSKFSWRQFCSLAVFFLSFSHPFPNKIKNLWGKRKTTTELDWAVGYCIFHLSTSFAYSRCTLQSFPPLLKIQIAYKKGGEESADSMLHPALARDPAFSHIFLLLSQAGQNTFFTRPASQSSGHPT